MRRRWKRRLIWSAVLLGLLVLSIPAWVSQGTARLRAVADRAPLRDGTARLGGARRSPYDVELVR
jgi:hypothetical protein